MRERDWKKHNPNAVWFAEQGTTAGPSHALAYSSLNIAGDETYKQSLGMDSKRYIQLTILYVPELDPRLCNITT